MFNHPFFLPYDVYSRHRTVAQLMAKPKTVLDVGGSLSQLSQFASSSTKVFTTDVVGGDIVYDGSHLPFKDKSVTDVVSIDTLEHVPKSHRASFLSELVRVAQHQVVISAPLGTPAHIQAEKEELLLSKAQGRAEQYLAEHVKLGLPTLAEIKALLQPFPHHQLLFQGDFRIARALFQFHGFEVKLPVLKRLFFEFKKLIYLFINLILFPLEKSLPLSQTINRFYVTITLR